MKKKPTKKPSSKMGRPKTVDGNYGTPRQIGRWSDDDWAKIQAAIKKSGKKQTQWFRDVLIPAAISQE